MLMRIRHELLVELACPHIPPGDWQCATCRLIQEKIGFEAHMLALDQSEEYRRIWARKMTHEIRYFRFLRVVPWIDLASTVSFYILAFYATMFACAISNNEHGSYQHAGRMFADAGIAVLVYYSQRRLRKDVT